MKKECKNCQKSFEPERVNQIYCSNSCKQKAYKEKKGNEAKTNQEIIEKPILKFEDYDHVQSELFQFIGTDSKDFDLDPIMYFYLIQTYKETDINKKTDYIISLCHYGRSNYSRFRKMNEFIEFESKYLNGSFEII